MEPDHGPGDSSYVDFFMYSIPFWSQQASLCASVIVLASVAKLRRDKNKENTSVLINEIV